MSFKAVVTRKAVFILIAGLLPLAACAVEFSVGVGLSDGGDNPALQRDYARLEQDIRALQRLERQLDDLGRQDPPASLQEGEKGEWLRQSAALLKQAEEAAALADEVENYLHGSRHDTRSAGLFDYQAAKFKITQQLDAMEDAAKKYALKGQAASQRRDAAVKQMAATF